MTIKNLYYFVLGEELSNRYPYATAIPLDGFIAKENDDLQWLEETEGEGDNGYADMYQSIDTVIMGKRTYDYILEHSDTFPYPDKNAMCSQQLKLGKMSM